MTPALRMKGRFVVLDGPDGCGKSTQLARLVRWCAAAGVAVEEVREPGGTAIGMHAALTPGTAHANAALADGRKHRTAIGVCRNAVGVTHPPESLRRFSAFTAVCCAQQRLARLAMEQEHRSPHAWATPIHPLPRAFPTRISHDGSRIVLVHRTPFPPATVGKADRSDPAAERPGTVPPPSAARRPPLEQGHRPSIRRRTSRRG